MKKNKQAMKAKSKLCRDFFFYFQNDVGLMDLQNYYKNEVKI